jgi:hypothetical protein
VRILPKNQIILESVVEVRVQVSHCYETH